MIRIESDHHILRVKDLCDLLQVHQTTVYKLVKKGRFPAFALAPTGHSEGSN